MKRDIEGRLKAIELRKKGYSLNEIVEELGIAKGSASVWVRNVPLSAAARRRLLTRIKLGQLLSAESKRRKTQELLDSYREKAAVDLGRTNLNHETNKLVCSLLYWCEGGKNHYHGVSFTNSDPKLIKTFLCLLRNSFELDEKKFRPCIHLHEYHNPRKQLDFWSKITDIPKDQFIKPFRKPNTGKRIRTNYPGCIAIKYHSTAVARQLLAAAEVFLSKYGGVG